MSPFRGWLLWALTCHIGEFQGSAEWQENTRKPLILIENWLHGKMGYGVSTHLQVLLQTKSW